MRALVFAGICVGTLSGCTTAGFGQGGYASAPSLLPVSSVVNAIKCELGETFIKRPDLRDRIASDPNKADIKASLQLKNVLVDYRAGGGGFQIPILGIELGPSIALSGSQTTGQTFDVDFSYDVEAAEKLPTFCDNPQELQNPSDPPELLQVVRVEGDPFISMLDATVQQYRRFGAGIPKVKLVSLAHTSSFAVENDASGGLNAKVIIFSLNSKVGRKTNEAQQLKVVFGLNFEEVIQ